MAMRRGLRLAVEIQDGLPWAGDLFAALGRRASPIRLDLVQTGRDMPAQSVHQKQGRCRRSSWAMPPSPALSAS